MYRHNEESKRTRFINFLYNSESKAILGRSLRSWSLIFIFYFCAYIFLAGFFVGLSSVFFFGFIDKNIPMRTGEHSLLANNPGLALAARPSQFNTFIQVATYSSSINAEYLLQATKLLNSYKPKSGNTKCSDKSVQPVDINHPCRFDLNLLGPCGDPEVSLIVSKMACLYLKLNRIYGWLPDIDISQTDSNKVVMVKCKYANAADADELPVISYYPQIIVDGKKYGLFHNKYYPFINQPHYHSPLVAIRFTKVRFNSVLQIECHTVGLRNGGTSTQFELFVSNETRSTA